MGKKRKARGQQQQQQQRPRHPSGFSVAGPITSISLRGFKSHRDTPEVALRPLTILAGENSGGKSSIVQPLLLMKQTLEAQYDPGVLDLRGTCVELDRAIDLFWCGGSTQDVKESRNWSIRFGVGDIYIEVEYHLDGGAKGGIVLHETRITLPEGKIVKLREDMAPDAVNNAYKTLSEAGVLGRFFIPGAESFFQYRAVSGRCAHGFAIAPKDTSWVQVSSTIAEEVIPRRALGGMIHLPGLRGNPERAYRVTRVEERFPGLFQTYTASVLEHWQEKRSPQLQGVKEDLAVLRLTRQVQTNRVDDTRVEVRLGRRLGDSGEDDLVNIADVGFGASQALPVVVALRVAAPDQLVHIEQPELHLHPNAQVAMAGLLIAAARRGARLIVETHSSVLLKAIQLAVAEDASGRLRDDIALHWFERDEAGASVVRMADLGADGSFGDWPIDFADVEMDIHRRFIEASSRRRREAT